MANTLSKTGITDNSTIRTWHVTQSIDAFTKAAAYDITLSGSFEIIGPSNLTLPITGTNITSASYSVSSSYSLNGLTASYTTNADVSKDTFFLQLHHGSLKSPISNSSTLSCSALCPCHFSGITKFGLTLVNGFNALLKVFLLCENACFTTIFKLL